MNPTAGSCLRKKSIKIVPESGRIMSFFKWNSTFEDANESEPPSNLTTELSAELQDHEDASDESGDNEADTCETKNAPSKFQPKWCSLYHWLKYDSERNLMLCKLCRDLKFTNAMWLCTSNFNTSTLSRHVRQTTLTSTVETCWIWKYGQCGRQYYY